MVDPLRLAALSDRDRTAVLTVRGWTVVVGEPLGVLRSAAELDAFADVCGWRADADPELPPFVGGAVGHLTDDAAGRWLALPADQRPDPSHLPAIRFAVHDSAVCVPPEGGPPWLVAGDLPGWSRHPAPARLAALATQVATAAAAGPVPALTPARPQDLRRSLDESAHRAAVERILEWIAAGDLYQLSLTLALGVPWAAGGPALARRLWDASPHAAHAAYLDTGDAAIVSISPETFLRTDGDRVRVRPIKGTRPRSSDPATDAAAARQLEASAKDHAEHVMIVDLERNDLGRIARIGSVSVPELAALEAHPTVWHLTSTVEARMQETTRVSDLLAAMFPCGSVTGAPKRMAVARTRAVEPVRRGVYCGSVGVLTHGLVDLSVAIRTALLREGIATYGTGGGIVADSDPAAEHAEAMDKAAAFLVATGASPQSATGSTPASRRPAWAS